MGKRKEKEVVYQGDSSGEPGCGGWGGGHDIRVLPSRHDVHLQSVGLYDLVSGHVQEHLETRLHRYQHH